jgi:hypothetical protein
MKPYSSPEHIATVNRRKAVPGECQRKPISASDIWVWQEDPTNKFAEKVVTQGSSTNGWSILEIDLETVYLAFQIAVKEGNTQLSEKDRIMQNAEKQLFKEGAKTFVLMHDNDGIWAITDSEPLLYPQREENGRLVGMSQKMGLGIGKHEIGMLMFEDKVCQEDVSYAVGMNFNVAEKVERLGSWFRSTDYPGLKFVIGGEQSPLAVLATAYKPIISKKPKYQANNNQSVNVRGIIISWQDWLSIAQFALDLVSLIAKL